MSLALKALAPEDAQAIWTALQDIPPENGLENAAYGMPFETYVREEIPRRIAMSRGEGLKPGHVPDTYYFLWDEGRIVAWFKFRHCLNEGLKNGGGHIGYGVCRSARGKGYAKRGLAMMIDLARAIVPEDELYLACNKNNPASLRVMLANGACIHHEENGEIFTRIKL